MHDWMVVRRTLLRYPAGVERHAAVAAHARCRSRLRYCTASAACAVVMRSLPSRSAIVRATLRMRWYARADRRNRSKALRRSRATSVEGRQCRRRSAGPIWPLAKTPAESQSRSTCRSRARVTRSRTVAVPSPARSPASSRNGTAGPLRGGRSGPGEDPTPSTDNALCASDRIRTAPSRLRTNHTDTGSSLRPT